MEFHCTVSYRLPDELIRILGITEDTAFEAFFEDGYIVIRPLSDDEVERVIRHSPEATADRHADRCTEDCDTCAIGEACPYEDEDDLFCTDLPDEEDYDDGEDENVATTDECANCEYFCKNCRKCTLK